MFLGHYGIAFAAKRLAPRTSLGTLSFAAQFCDELWPILLLLGVEQVHIEPGVMAANPLDFASYPISHSLLAVIVWAVVIGVAYAVMLRKKRGAIVIGLAVLSHWFLDLPMHRPDLPLMPGVSTKVGFGLWRSLHLTLVLELLVFAGGIWVYLRTTRARDRMGTWTLWAMILVLTATYLGSLFGPAPKTERGVAIGALGLWIFVPWAAWIDWHRTPRGSAPH